MTRSFIAGKPVTGKNLIGRESVISQILSLVAKGQSVVLIAPRRFGKTSVLLEVLNRSRNENVFQVYIDFFAIPNKRILAEEITRNVLQNRKLDQLFNRFKTRVSELLRDIEFRQVVEDFEFILDFTQPQKDQYYLLRDSLDFIEQFSVKHNTRIICGFDEFGDLEKLNGKEIIKLFRSVIQLQEHTTYIFTGSYESVMNQIFVSSKSPFHRFARIIHLGMVEPDEFKEFLFDRFFRLGININPEAVQNILNFTHGHPYYTQLIAQQIELYPKNSVSPQDIGDYVEDVMWTELNYLEGVWSEISRSKESVAVLLSLLDFDKSPYTGIDTRKVNVSRAIRRLIGQGYLRKEAGKYEFNDPLLVYWICRNILKKDTTQCV